MKLMRYIKIIEDNLQKKAIIKFKKLKIGDVIETHASSNKLFKLTKYSPKIGIEKGIAHFVKWFKEYHKYNVKK